MLMTFSAQTSANMTQVTRNRQANNITGSCQAHSRDFHVAGYRQAVLLYIRQKCFKPGAT
jgi:formylglycine-generating enzyme required for sulfatase activity